MSKQILPSELAEIVNNLLVNPAAVSELDTTERYQEFMRDIGQVVAEHCGGEVTGISKGSFGKGYDHEYTPPTLQVIPNSSLPSLTDNVWSKYDPEGWDEDNLPEI